MNHLTEASSLNFAAVPLKEAKQKLMEAIKCLSSTDDPDDIAFLRIMSLAKMGEVLSDMREEMLEQVDAENCDCESCTLRRQQENLDSGDD